MATLSQAYPEARMTVTALKATATSEAAGQLLISQKRPLCSTHQRSRGEELQQPGPVATLTEVSNEYVHVQKKHTKCETYNRNPYTLRCLAHARIKMLYR